MTVKVSTRKAYPPGVHVPSLTWFENTTEQEISWPTQKKHFQFLVESGLHGGTYHCQIPVREIFPNHVLKLTL